MTLLNDLKHDEIEYFKIKPKPFHTKYKTLTMDCMYSLLFIIFFLEERGLTLSHICLNDFEIYEQYMFLKSDIHIVELMNDKYVYELKDTSGIEFLPPKNINHKTHLYSSVGQFSFWILTHLNKPITENDLEPYYYTKPYFFIKNTMGQNPCLIYL